MIKILSTNRDGKQTIILGLSRINVDLLMNGKPIKVEARDLEHVGPNLDVILIGGETEAAIVAELQSAGLIPAWVPAETPPVGQSVFVEFDQDRPDDRDKARIVRRPI